MANAPLGLHINLNDTTRPEGAMAIVDALKEGRSPARLLLNLINNGIGSKEAIAIAETLASGRCPAGLYINLSGNRIGPEGTKTIAKALASGSCPAGLRINLSENGIGPEGAKAIAEALKTGLCPNELKLRLGSHISRTELEQLLDALKSYKCPPGFKLEFHPGNMEGINKESLDEINKLLRTYQMKHTAITLAAFNSDLKSTKIPHLRNPKKALQPSKKHT